MRSPRVAVAIAALERPRDCLWRLELVKHWALVRDDGLPLTRRRSMITAASTLLALTIAWLLLLLDVWRSRNEGKADALPEASAMAAVHAELTNRTRHLLRLLPDDGSVPVLLLGRPRLRLDAARSLFAREYAGFAAPLVRALSPRALVHAFPSQLAATFTGMRVMARAPRPPTVTGLIAIGYRVLAGEVHAAWWCRRSPGPRCVVFGHTGVADTSRLEQAMQTAGTATVHLAHGISNGYSFDGLSDLLIAGCRHDAHMHLALGGYRATTWPAAVRPSARIPERPGSVLLTNFAHGTNPVYAEHGISAEETVIAVASEGLADEGAAGRHHYRPHPAIELLPKSEQEAVRERAASDGMLRWPADWPYAMVSLFRVVLTTPSTVLLDLMRAGRAPILLAAAEADELTCYAHYPVQAQDGAALQKQLAMLTREADWLAEAWARIGPARAIVGWPDLSDLIATALQPGAAPDVVIEKCTI